MRSNSFLIIIILSIWDNYFFFRDWSFLYLLIFVFFSLTYKLVLEESRKKFPLSFPYFPDDENYVSSIVRRILVIYIYVCIYVKDLKNRGIYIWTLSKPFLSEWKGDFGNGWNSIERIDISDGTKKEPWVNECDA